jgi:hypothetical protein
VTPSGIETATFWLVAQCLNQLRRCVPHIKIYVPCPLLWIMISGLLLGVVLSVLGGTITRLPYCYDLIMVIMTLFFALLWLHHSFPLLQLRHSTMLSTVHTWQTACCSTPTPNDYLLADGFLQDRSEELACTKLFLSPTLTFQSLPVTWSTNSLTFSNCISAQAVFMCWHLSLKNIDLCHLQHKIIGFYNREEKCLQRGTDRVFK